MRPTNLYKITQKLAETPTNDRKNHILIFLCVMISDNLYLKKVTNDSYSKMVSLAEYVL